MLNDNKKIHIKLISSIISIIFLGEALNILLLEKLIPLAGSFAYMLKPGLLVLISTPVLYYFVFLLEKKRLASQSNIESQLRIANTAFQIRDALMVTNAQGEILRVNKAFENFTGYREHEILGENPRILSSGHHDKAFYKKMWDKIINEGSWKGEIWDKSKDGMVYPKYTTITAVKNKSDVITHYVAIFTAISDRKKSEEEIFRLAYYDALTSLPNRRLFLDRLDGALASSARTSQYGALLFLDLDNFKAVNDTFGHQKGDDLLIEVAERLQSCIREVDTVARLGGDEFVVLLQNLGQQNQDASHNVTKIAESLRHQLCQPYLNDSINTISPSVGVTLFIGRTMGVEKLLQHADSAMYQAKKAGRNHVSFYRPQGKFIQSIESNADL